MPKVSDRDGPRCNQLCYCLPVYTGSSIFTEYYWLLTVYPSRRCHRQAEQRGKFYYKDLELKTQLIVSLRYYSEIDGKN